MKRSEVRVLSWRGWQRDVPDVWPGLIRPDGGIPPGSCQRYPRSSCSHGQTSIESRGAADGRFRRARGDLERLWEGFHGDLTQSFNLLHFNKTNSVSEGRRPTQNTHTQLLNECIMNTEETFTELIYLHLHNRRAYCVFTSNILKYVSFSDTVILLNVNMAIILYHHSIVCLNNTFDT